MKVVAVREAKQQLSACIDEAQRDRVLITKHGRPAALVIGVEGKDIEEVMLVSNPRFWRLIEERRAGKRSVSLEEARRELGLPPRSRRPAAK